MAIRSSATRDDEEEVEEERRDAAGPLCASDTQSYTVVA